MNRKEFLKKSAMASVFVAGLPKFSGAVVKGSDKIKVAIVGCGGRGRGALFNMFCADQNIELVAIGDAFAVSIENAKKYLQTNIEKRFPNKFKDYWKVGDNAFVGLDAIDKVVKTDADVVVLATPPVFRTAHIQKCLDNNKNIFAEKPIAIDATQLRYVYNQLIPLANAKKLNVVCGTQMRYQEAIKEAVMRVREGQIGDIISAQFLRYEPTYLMGATVATKDNNLLHGADSKGTIPEDIRKLASLQPEDAEYQLRNWLAFVWTSGGQYVEQYIHNLDMALWALEGCGMPDTVIGSGGRQTDLPFPKMGNRYSNYHVDFEYSNGVYMSTACRQEKGASGYAPFKVYGTKGVLRMSFGKQIFTGEKPCVIETPKKQALVAEHEYLLNAIRSGNHVNTMKTHADSCYIAIAGREAAYSGKRFKCEFILKKSKQNLMPEKFELGMKLPIAPVPCPSTYKLV